MRFRARLALMAIVLVAQASCNAILGLDAVDTVGDAPDGMPDALTDAAPDSPGDGPMDGGPDAPPDPLAAPVITTITGQTVNTPTPTIAGTCLIGAQVTVFADDGSDMLTWCTTACTAESTFACAPTASQLNGTYSVVAKQTLGGETSQASVAIAITIEVTALTISGISPGGTIGGAPVAIAGSCASGGVVTVSDNGTPFCSNVPCGANNNYACAARSFTHGAHTLTAAQTGPADSASLAFAVDSVAPAMPSITSPAGNISINTTIRVIAGTCEPGAIVTVSNNGSPPNCTDTCDGDGNFSCELSGLANGTTYSVIARQADAVGNISAPSSPPRLIKVDTTAPPAPTLTLPVPNANVCDETPTIAGGCESEATVTVYRMVNGNIQTTLCTTTCVAGTFSCTSTTALALGTQEVSAGQTDPVGNTSGLAASTFISIFSSFDYESDGHPDACDNCPHVANTLQTNTGDNDGLGDECDLDTTTAQNIAAFYPIVDNINPFTPQEGWANSNGYVSLGQLKVTSAGAISKVFAGTAVGEVVLGYGASIGDGNGVAIELTTPAGVVTSCKVEGNDFGAWFLKYFRNGTQGESTSTGSEGILRQSIVLAPTAYPVNCYAGVSFIVGAPPGMDISNASTVRIRLLDPSSYIDYVLLVRNN